MAAKSRLGIGRDVDEVSVPGGVRAGVSSGPSHLAQRTTLWEMLGRVRSLSAEVQGDMA